MLLTLNTITELYFGYNPLNDTERFRHIRDFVETIYAIDDDSFPFAVLLVAAITEGTNPNTLSHFCGMPLDFVTEVAERLKASKLWLKDGSTDYEFLTAKAEDLWHVCFTMETLTAKGMFVSDGVKIEGYRGYQFTEAGRCVADACCACEESSLTN